MFVVEMYTIFYVLFQALQLLECYVSKSRTWQPSFTISVMKQVTNKKIPALVYMASGFNGNQLTTLPYTEIFNGHKIHEFCFELVEHETLILEKKQWLKETMYSI